MELEVLTKRDKDDLRRMGIAPFAGVMVSGKRHIPAEFDHALFRRLTLADDLLVQLKALYAAAAHNEIYDKQFTAHDFGWYVRAIVESGTAYHAYEELMVGEEWCWNAKKSGTALIPLSEIGNFIERVHAATYHELRRTYALRAP